MKTFALMIDATYEESKEITKSLRTSFPSEDYMRGFVEAYVFGRGQLMTLEEYQEAQHLKVFGGTLDVNYLYFLTVVDPDDGKED